MSYITPAQFRDGMQNAKDYVDGIIKSGGGVSVQSTYIVGSQPFFKEWLSFEEDGEAFIPVDGNIYVIETPGEYFGSLVKWYATKKAYRLVGSKNTLSDPVIRNGHEEKTINITDTTMYNTTSAVPEGRVFANFDVYEGMSIHVHFDFDIRGSYFSIPDALSVGIGELWKDLIAAHASGADRITTYTGIYEQSGTYDKTVIVTKEMANSGAQFVFKIERMMYNQSASISDVYIDTITPLLDYETNEYVPISETQDGQSGLVPSISKDNTSAEALTPRGWDEVDFNVTEDEVFELFADPIPQTNKLTNFFSVLEHQRYNTEEQVIGVWTDGKPLYRKVIADWVMPNVVTDGTAVTEAHNISELNIETLSLIRGYVKTADSFQMFQGEVSGRSINVGDVHYNTTQNTLIIRSTMKSASLNPCVIIIEYTKTTDTPQSTKVPFEPLVEYSTDEKMVGYWIDGKPLYRKTVVANILDFTSSSDINKYYDVNISVDTPVSINTIFKVNVNGIDSYIKESSAVSGDYQYITQFLANSQHVRIIVVLGNISKTRITGVISTLEYTKTSD